MPDCSQPEWRQGSSKPAEFLDESSEKTSDRYRAAWGRRSWRWRWAQRVRWLAGSLWALISRRPGPGERLILWELARVRDERDDARIKCCVLAAGNLRYEGWVARGKIDMRGTCFLRAEAVRLFGIGEAEAARLFPGDPQ